jgi:hypothetical protein
MVMLCPLPEYASSTLSIGSHILKSVERYGSLPIDYIASIFGRRREEVEDYIYELEKRSLVKVRNDKVVPGDLIGHTSLRGKVYKRFLRDSYSEASRPGSEPSRSRKK